MMLAVVNVHCLDIDMWGEIAGGIRERWQAVNRRGSRGLGYAACRGR